MRCLQKKSPDGTEKHVIGKGGLGKIRYAIVVNGNDGSMGGRSGLIPGQILCVKKTGNSGAKRVPINEIRENTWNDYSSEEVGKLVLIINFKGIKNFSEGLFTRSV